MKPVLPRVTRRALAAWAGAAVAAKAQPAAGAADELSAARQRLEQNLTLLRRVRLDPKVEPAFSFKA